MLTNWQRWLALLVTGNLGGKVTMKATLRAVKITKNGEKTDYGIVSRRLVTQTFVKRLAAQMAVDFSGADEWKYHGSGTDNTAEANSDAALGVEVDTRVAGTQVDTSAGTTGNYRSVATQTYAGTYTIREHGLFNASTLGVMLDRSVFAGINVFSGDSITFTYDLTINPE